MIIKSKVVFNYKVERKYLHFFTQKHGIDLYLVPLTLIPPNKIQSAHANANSGRVQFLAIKTFAP